MHISNGRNTHHTHTHTHTHHIMSYSRSGHGSRAWWWGLHFQQGIKGKSFGAGAVWKAWLKQDSMHVRVREKGALGWGHSKQRPQGAICLLIRGPRESQHHWSGGRATGGGNEVRDSQGLNLWAMVMTWSFILPVLPALVMMVGWFFTWEGRG